MLETRKTAERVNRLVLDASAAILDSMEIVRRNATETEYAHYKRRAAYVLAALYEHILHDLWLQHPELEAESAKQRPPLPDD